MRARPTDVTILGGCAPQFPFAAAAALPAPSWGAAPPRFPPGGRFGVRARSLRSLPCAHARRFAAAAALLGLAVLLGACSSPPPPPRDETAELARYSKLDIEIHDLGTANAALAARVAALEAALAMRKHPDDDLAARIAAIESKLSAAEDKVAALELAHAIQAAESEKRDVIIDRKSDARASAPAPGEVVKPLAAIDGESFSFVRNGTLDLARLAGVEAPRRDVDDERRAREAEAWGETLDRAAAAARVHARLEELLTQGALSFTYPDAAPAEKRGLVVYAHVKRPDGSEIVVNEVLIREGLALPQGDHPQRAAYEKLGDEARSKKAGFFEKR
jgi:endonuclease YncB( thermonuclease family)